MVAINLQTAGVMQDIDIYNKRGYGHQTGPKNFLGTKKWLRGFQDHTICISHEP